MTILQTIRITTLLVTTGVFFAACSGPGDGAMESRVTETEMDMLVSVDWLREHLDDPDLVVLDCTVVLEQAADGALRSVSGRGNFEAGHIPNAGFADLTSDLSDTGSPYRYAVPAPEQFAAAMSALGVGDDSRVVLYDASGSVWASRVWWMLRWIGFDRAALLDGGLNAWTAAGHSLSTEIVSRSPGALSVNLRPELIADRDEVFAAIGDKDVKLIDALPESHFRGEMAMYERPGHIPGAENIPVFSAINETGHYRSIEELEALFEIDRDSRAINYCGGGIAASANAFIMTRLGYKDVAVYTASLQEWAADPANPLEVSPATEKNDN